MGTWHYAFVTMDILNINWPASQVMFWSLFYICECHFRRCVDIITLCNTSKLILKNILKRNLSSGNLSLGQTCVHASQCTGTTNCRRCLEDICICDEGFLPHDLLCLHGIYWEEKYKFEVGKHHRKTWYSSYSNSNSFSPTYIL